MDISLSSSDGFFRLQNPIYVYLFCLHQNCFHVVSRLIKDLKLFKSGYLILVLHGISPIFMIVLAVTSCHQNLGPTSWQLCDLISNTLSLSKEFGPADYVDSKQLLYCMF